MSETRKKNSQAVSLMVLALVVLAVVWLIAWPWGILIDRWIWGLAAGLSIPLALVVALALMSILIRRKS